MNGQVANGAHPSHHQPDLGGVGTQDPRQGAALAFLFNAVGVGFLGAVRQDRAQAAWNLVVIQPGRTLSRGREQAFHARSAEQAALRLKRDAPRHQARGVIGRIIGEIAFLGPRRRGEQDQRKQGEQKTAHLKT